MVSPCRKRLHSGQDRGCRPILWYGTCLWSDAFRAGKVQWTSHMAGQKSAVSIARSSVSLFIDAAYKSALVITLGACLFGCASPDLPTARHPIVPVPVSDLSARQVGETVILTFTLPVTSTDQQPLVDMPSVEIYRNTRQAATPVPKRAAKNRSTARLADTIPSQTVEQYQKNGRIEFPDKLDPDELAEESGTDFIYTVRTRVSRAKVSADSNAVDVRVYPAPETVQDLRATLTETALVLDWSAAQKAHSASAGQAAGFRIYRTEVDPAMAEAAVFTPSQAKLIAPPELLAQTTATEYRDTTFQFGHTYFYSVRRILQFGAATVESADSSPTVLTAKDIFPPAAPQDLEAVGVTATNGTPASVELTWSINAEPDLAGYNVYRSEQAGASGQKLNSELLLVPTFRDMSVVPGKSYFYRVGAADQSGNESPLSSAVEARIPEP